MKLRNLKFFGDAYNTFGGGGPLFLRNLTVWISIKKEFEDYKRYELNSESW